MGRGAEVEAERVDAGADDLLTRAMRELLA